MGRIDEELMTRWRTNGELTSIGEKAWEEQGKHPREEGKENARELSEEEIVVNLMAVLEP